MVAVILPSRGLMFSQTADEILKNLKNIPHKFYFSHRQPIPACFEVPTHQALENKEVTHLWFVEDDMILPPHTLKDMLDMDKAVVTANYPTTKKQDASILTVKKQIIYGGTGCLLVKREVFAELRQPYFRDDIAWTPKNYGDCLKFTGQKVGSGQGYGLHDVNFYINLFRRGIPVHKLDYTLGQRKLVALGKQGTNNGAHRIQNWTKVNPDRYDNLIKHLPVMESGKLVEIITPSGGLNASPEHAKKLVKAGLATYPPKRPVVIDDSEVL